MSLLIFKRFYHGQIFSPSFLSPVFHRISELTRRVDANEMNELSLSFTSLVKIVTNAGKKTANFSPELQLRMKERSETKLERLLLHKSAWLKSEQRSLINCPVDRSLPSFSTNLPACPPPKPRLDPWIRCKRIASRLLQKSAALSVGTAQKSGSGRG